MTVKGSCLCGAVRYTIDGPMRDMHGCHCTQCRKQSGHYVAAANAPRTAVKVTGEDAITWFEASPGIRRGFCSICGSHLFWDDPTFDTISINAGALEAPTGLRMAAHIFVADKGDYYEIADGLPQYDAYPAER